MENLLLIEDNSLQREVLERLYAHCKEACRRIFHGEVGLITADSWASGMKIVESGRISVIILDLALPPFGRNETLTALASSNGLPPVVALTGLDDAVGLGIREKAFACGVDDYMLKSEFNHRPEELFERVYHAYLRRNRPCLTT